MLKIFKNKHKKGEIGKDRKEKLLLLITENIGEKLDVFKTIKYQLNIEKNV